LPVTHAKLVDAIATLKTSAAAVVAALPGVTARTPFSNPYLPKDLGDLFTGVDATLADVIKTASIHREALLRGDGPIRVPDVAMPPAAPSPEIERQIIYVHQHSKWMEFGEAKTAPKWAHAAVPVAVAEKAIAANLADRIDSDRANKLREVYGVACHPAPSFASTLESTEGGRRQASDWHRDDRRDHRRDRKYCEVGPSFWRTDRDAAGEAETTMLREIPLWRYRGPRPDLLAIERSAAAGKLEPLPPPVEPCDFADIPLIVELRQRHEAAHFCCAVHYGFSVRGASVTAGAARVEWTSATSRVGDLIRHMTVLASGQAAQHRFGATGNLYEHGGDFDNARIAAIANEIETALGRGLPI
jgi:hypothetical protein